MKPWTKPHWSHLMSPERSTFGSLHGGNPRSLRVRECWFCKADQARHAYAENHDACLRQPCWDNPVIPPLYDEWKAKRDALVARLKAEGLTDDELEMLRGRINIPKPGGYEHPEP